MERDNVLQGPWTKQMSLNAFHSKAKQYLAILNTEQESLSYIFKLFRSGKVILPDQCKRTITFINRLDEPLQEFCKLLETPDQLPEAVVPLRYLLAMALHHTEEQIKELLRLINHFLIISQRASKQSVKERQEIQSRLELLIKGCNDIQEKYSTLLDQARFQERKIANL